MSQIPSIETRNREQDRRRSIELKLLIAFTSHHTCLLHCVHPVHLSCWHLWHTIESCVFIIPHYPLYVLAVAFPQPQNSQ